MKLSIFYRISNARYRTFKLYKETDKLKQKKVKISLSLILTLIYYTLLYRCNANCISLKSGE